MAGMILPMVALGTLCFLVIAPWLVVAAFRGRMQLTIALLMLWPAVLLAALIALRNGAPGFIVSLACLGGGFAAAWMTKPVSNT